MAEFLLVADQVSPVVDGELAGCAAALALALSVAKHRVTVLSLATPDQTSGFLEWRDACEPSRPRGGGGPRILALRRTFGGEPVCALRARRPFGQSWRRAALLASTATSLVRDQICWPDVVVDGRDHRRWPWPAPRRSCGPGRAGRTLGPTSV